MKQRIAQAIVLTFLFLGIATAAEFETINGYIVELNVPSVSKGGTKETIEATRKEFFECLKEKNVAFTETSSFSTLYAGATVGVADADLGRLKQCKQVKSVSPNREVPAMAAIEGGDPHTMEVYAHEMTGVKRLREMGYDGEGIKDSGIDYTHPAFGTCTKVGDEGCIIKHGYNFVDDNDDPFDDTIGHGTHVAGIIAGNDPKNQVVGVAPKVTLGVYKIFGQDKRPTADIIMKAMRQAYKDGMDIVNLSFGTASGSPESPESLVLDELTRLGMIFSVAVGNDGEEGVWFATQPSVASRANSVSSFDSAKGVRGTFTVSGLEKKIVFAFTTHPGQVSATLVAPPMATNTTTNLCERLLNMNVGGKLLLVRRDECEFVEDLVNYASSALGIVVYNNRPGDMGSLSTMRVPLYTIVESQGKELHELVDKNQGRIDIQIDAATINVDWANGGQVSSFSSWGLAPNMDLKPDFGAPGGFIYSTYPKNKGSYAVLSGTSMAAPYVSGCYALFLQHLRKTQNIRKYGIEVETLKEIIMNYASAIDNQEDADHVLMHPVARQGSGLIQIDRAILGKARVSPGRIPLGNVAHPDGKPQDIEVRFSVINSDEALHKEFTISSTSVSTVLVSNPSDPKVLNSSSLASFWNGDNFVTSIAVTVPPNQSKEIRAVISPDREIDLASGWYFISGFFTVIPKTVNKNNGTISQDVHDYTMSVPYTGVLGTPPSPIDPAKIELFLYAPRTSSEPTAIGTTTTPLVVDDFLYDRDDMEISIPSTMPVTLDLALLDENKKLLGYIRDNTHHSRTSTKKGPRLLNWKGPYRKVDGGDPVLPTPGKYFVRVSYQMIAAINEANLPMKQFDVADLEVTFKQIAQ